MKTKRKTSSTSATPTVAAVTFSLLLAACGTATTVSNDSSVAAANVTAATPAKRPATDYLSQPLVTDIYTADPSAHVWSDGKLYIYPSHDIDGDAARSLASWQ